MISLGYKGYIVLILIIKMYYAMGKKEFLKFLLMIRLIKFS